MNLNNFTQGILTLSKYYDDSDGYCISAEHDIFYMYATDKPLSSKDVKAMIDYGWLQEEADYEDEFEPKHYMPDEGWAAYT